MSRRDAPAVSIRAPLVVFPAGQRAGQVLQRRACLREVFGVVTANVGRMNSIATDHRESTGSPHPHLRGIAEAGFSHVHWCHQWNTDFLYCDPEIVQIQRWLDELGLKVTDVHASAGREKAWASEQEYERLAGVELVRNRLEMTARLGSDVAVLHIPEEPEEEAACLAYWTRVRRSLDTLLDCCRATGVRIALENGSTPQSWVPITKILAAYPPDFAGLCYDAGHGNISGDGLDQLARHGDRLISLHLHDNDGTGDQHLLPFMGSVDWDRLARLISESGYDKWVNLEVSEARSGYKDERAFLQEALAIAQRLTEAIANA